MRSAHSLVIPSVFFIAFFLATAVVGRADCRGGGTGSGPGPQLAQVSAQANRADVDWLFRDCDRGTGGGPLA